eukprot:TRINITY_DN4311_c0_g1_i1.p1 TRINITY_DN4311_c0_g1~~TRINITY_DN4311_c0_g1_i1.p1  ORF type:complete len:222 (+),score=75.59 TRINITY_DN4311_c0_g1_i1:42-668(+)
MAEQATTPTTEAAPEQKADAAAEKPAAAADAAPAEPAKAEEAKADTPAKDDSKAAAASSATAADGNESDEEPADDEPRVIPGEEDETEVFKMRARLFRFATTDEGKEWKDRGTGDARILKHNESGKYRIVMRREKTLKLCANHLILPGMKLEVNVTSDRSWVYHSPADLADDEPKPETFAIRFANADNARLFKEKFEACQKELEEKEK